MQARGDGGAIQWRTYVGIGDRDIVRDVDSAGNVYVTGPGCSDLEANAQYAGKNRNTRAAQCDSVVAKISSDGGTLEWFRYLGSNGNDGEWEPYEWMRWETCICS